MNTIFKSTSLCCVLAIVTCIVGILSAECAEAVKEGIKVTVQTSKGENGNPQVDCVLTNNSSKILAFARIVDSGEFQIKLYGDTGKQIAQEPKWAKRYNQIGSPTYNYAKSSMAILIKPGEKYEFHFLLKDASGDKAAMGRKLDVDWNNYWGQATLGVLTRDTPTSEVYEKQIITPIEGNWNVSVSLALNSSGEEVAMLSLQEKELVIRGLPRCRETFGSHIYPAHQRPQSRG